MSEPDLPDATLTLDAAPAEESLDAAPADLFEEAPAELQPEQHGAEMPASVPAEAPAPLPALFAEAISDPRLSKRRITFMLQLLPVSTLTLRPVVTSIRLDDQAPIVEYELTDPAILDELMPGFAALWAKFAAEFPTIEAREKKAAAKTTTPTPPKPKTTPTTRTTTPKVPPKPPTTGAAKSATPVAAPTPSLWGKPPDGTRPVFGKPGEYEPILPAGSAPARTLSTPPPPPQRTPLPPLEPAAAPLMSETTAAPEEEWSLDDEAPDELL